MIIVVDFDGTICKGTYPMIEGEQPAAGDSLRKLHEDGHYIILWTCRNGQPLIDALNWLLEHKIPFDRVNAHEPENLRQYGNDTRKVYADCYIDDRNLGGFPGWDVAIREIGKMSGEYRLMKSLTDEVFP